jgi:GNAT superfamily N-acetyltransferase
VTLRAVPYEEAAALTDALEAELRDRYQDDGATHAAAQQFVPPAGVFFVVEVDGRAVGCGGLRVIEPGVGEIKRMYVDPGARGQGLSRLVLQALVDFGREQGLTRLVLETGPKQPEAIALYASAGFTATEPYGEWVGNGGCSLFLGLALKDHDG